MKRQKGTFLYRLIKWLVWVFYPKTEIIGAENLPEDPAVLVGNHAQMNGPIIGELYLPRPCRIWCTAEMMNMKEVPAYAFRDFWSEKPKWIRWFYKVLSYVIAPLAQLIFTNADTIPVYHDRRVLDTFRISAQCLSEGKDVVIYPEQHVPYNQILWDFQEGFIDTARVAYKKTGKAPAFVPMYLAPALKKVIIGKPVRFDPNAPVHEERERIRRYLMDEITAMAQALPRHRVVPYPNMSKKEYPVSRPE